MVKGMRSFSDKERRKQRRHNHIAKDLRSPKYRMRRIEDKTRKEKYKNYYDEDYDDS